MQIALFGGTFDPVHKGHTAPLKELAEQFGWDQIQLLPTYQPPYRQQPDASDQERIDMLQLATSDDSRFVINTWELEQRQPSRTKNILNALHSEHNDVTVCFVIGMDSFIQLDSWLDWKTLFELSHFIVLPRPGYQKEMASAELMSFCEPRIHNDISEFKSGSGNIYLARTSPINCSATQLREQLKSANDCPRHIEPSVWQYIQHHKLYR